MHIPLFRKKTMVKDMIYKHTILTSKRDQSGVSEAGDIEATYRMNISACIMNIYVHPEVKNQRTLAKRTSQMMKNGRVVNTQMRSGTKCSR